MSISVVDFLRLALTEIRIARAGDVLSPEDQADALLILNELLDLWNTQGRALYNDVFQEYTLTPNLNPQTIGPTGQTFTASPRPTEILNANLVMTGTDPVIRLPFTIHTDSAWWMHIRAQTIQISIPRDLYYSPGWPNGSIYFWPVPNLAYGFEADLRIQLASLAATDTFDLPQGYQAALRLSLAEACAEAWGQPVSPSLQRRAAMARAAVFATNSVIPNAIADGGLPVGARRGGFNYLDGLVDGGSDRP